MPRKKSTTSDPSTIEANETKTEVAAAPDSANTENEKSEKSKKPAAKRTRCEATDKKPADAAAEVETEKAPTKTKASKSEKPATKQKPAVPLYGKLTSGEPKKVEKKEQTKAPNKGSFFNYGKITAEKTKDADKTAAEKKPRSSRKSSKKAAEKPAIEKESPKNKDKTPAAKGFFDRDAVFAEVFGYEYKPLTSKASKKAKPEKALPVKSGEPETNPPIASKAEKPAAPAKLIISLSPRARDQIFAEVFGYEMPSEPEPEAEPEIEPEKPKPSEEKPAAPAQQPPKEKKRKSGIFQLFKNSGKKSRPNFKRKKKAQPAEAPASETPEMAKPVVKAAVFDRDAVFAEVFGYEYKKPKIEPKPETRPAEEEAKTPAESLESAAEAAKPEIEAQPAVKEKTPPAEMDEDLTKLIAESYTGDYPKLTLRKPFTDSEKRWANEFEQFYKSRGYNVSFKVSGATKTGVISDKLFKSGKTEDVLRFFQAGKSITYTLFENGEDGYQKELLSNRFPRYTFDKRFEPILNTAQSFGLITSYYEHTDRVSGAAKLTAYFSKYQKVLDFFRGDYLESFAYYVAKKVAARVASERKLSFDIAANLVTTDGNGASIHEYDTVIRIGNQIFIIEEKSSPYFCDFNKFAIDMDRLQFSKKNYMLLVVNKNGEEAEAVEWLFDFRVANTETYAAKLRQMLEEGLDDSIPNV